MEDLKASLLQTISTTLASVSKPIEVIPLAVAATGSDSATTQNLNLKRKFDDNEPHDHQKGEKRQRLDSEAGNSIEGSADIGVADFEVSEMELAVKEAEGQNSELPGLEGQNSEMLILEVQNSEIPMLEETQVQKTVEVFELSSDSNKTEECNMEVDEDVNSGATENTEVFVIEDEVNTGESIFGRDDTVMTEQIMEDVSPNSSEEGLITMADISEEDVEVSSEVNNCRDIVPYISEISGSEIEERRMNEVLIRRMHSEFVRIMNTQRVQRLIRTVRPIDLLGAEDDTVNYSTEFQNAILDHFFDDLNSEEFQRIERFLLPEEYIYRSPIEIPRLNLPILKEPICDFILDMSDTPLTKQFIRDVFPEENYAYLYSQGDDTELIESFTNGYLNERDQMSYTEASNRFRQDDRKLQVQKVIEKVLEFQIEEFDNLKYVKIIVQKEGGITVSMTSFDFHRLFLDDQIFLVKFFACTEETWIELECRRILGIYVRNLYFYDFQLAIEERKRKCNLSPPINSSKYDHEWRGFICEEVGNEGFVYISSLLQRFFRLNDLVKYSDATLHYLLGEMQIPAEEEKAILKEKCLRHIKERLDFRMRAKDCSEWMLSEENPKKMHHLDFVFPAEYEVNGVYSEEVEIIPDISSQDVEMKDADQPEVSSSEIRPVNMNDLFLEFELPNFFQPREIEFLSVYHDRSESYQGFKLELIKCLGKSKQSVYSDSLITGIRELKVKKFRKNDYYSFEVLREDGKVYYFTEADFHKISVVDFYRLYNLMQNKDCSSKKLERGALAAIREAMFYILRWHAYTDFQVALWINRPCVYLSRPTVDHEHMKMIKTGNVTTYPVLGVFMKNGRQEKMFFRADEVAKYCSGTLRFIKNSLEKRLDKAKLVKETKEIIERIDRRLNIRNILLLKIVPALKELDDVRYSTI